MGARRADALRSGDVARTVTAYQEHHRLHSAANAYVRRREVTERFIAATAAGSDTVILVCSRDEAAALNDLCRDLADADGRLGNQSLVPTQMMDPH